MDQDEFLNNFFTQVTQHCFDKAKESVEKERERCKFLQMGPWGMLLTHLPQISVAERSYADLGFLHTKNKGFLRKDTSLKTMYESLRVDMKRLEEMTQGSNTIGTRIAAISSQLCQFVTARIQLIDFYEKMYSMSINSKVMCHQELLLSIEDISKCHVLSCSHVALNTIKAAFILECEILMQLIRAYIEMQNWRFLPSLMALYGAQTRMLAWEKTLQNRESWKLGFGTTFLKTNQHPALYQWLMKLRGAILAKFSLYFHTALSQQASSGEMKSIMNKQAIDYYHKLQSFQKKHDILAVMLIFDSRGRQDSGPGYKHPKRETDIIEDFSIVLSIPYSFSQKPFFHWDKIKSSIKECHIDLMAMDKVVLNKDQSDMWLHAMYNIDPQMTLIVAYEICSKQKDKNANIASFILEICMQLRCNKVFESLKLTK
ncbi:KICSTOR complex protein C12orf66 homolog [Copidosoma floridanum]|uniref:KICSTOR complex protein C12orf66 homolog n=1 Tax=Copidosoma floridanum TaxID=29053 RepID=UPI0006C9B769|nr:KICSTOR complex protein C12orf66 homolog [Copidosoma floridanum]